jgi:hypothetical protein
MFLVSSAEIYRLHYLKVIDSSVVKYCSPRAEAGNPEEKGNN